MLSSVQNLSDAPTSYSTLQLLSRPSKFIPTPPSRNHQDLFRCVVDFVRKLQWQASMPTSRAFQSCRFGHLQSSAWPPAGLVPLHIRTLSQRLLSGARSILFQEHVCFSMDNLRAEERLCLEDLRSNTNLVVRQADKGGRWVLMNSNLYRGELSRQLNDATFYRPLSAPLTDNTAVFTNVLQQLHDSGSINRKEFRFLSGPLQPFDRRLYVLPKIHKALWPSPNMPPGRPIISDVNTESSNIARLVEHFLFPLAKRLPSFLLDSQHLIALLRTHVLTPNSLLCTFDVCSLYTNIPVVEGCRRVARAFQLHPDVDRPDNEVLRLLELPLTRNDFTCNGDRWLQISGVAMGKSFGGSFANIYMGEWESSALQSSPLQPSFWCRFQDDIFAIWPHGLDSLHSFHLHLNSQDPRIQVEMKHDSDSIDFLDLTMYRASPAATQLSHKIFLKESACHSLLPRDSHHPPHVYRGVLFSQILRWALRSSTKEDFDATRHRVTPVWRAQGATRSIIRQTTNRVLRLTGLIPDWSPGFHRCLGPRCGACRFTSEANTFHGSSGDVFPVLFNMSCATTHCVYLVRCRACGILYVGQTSNPVRQRISEHLRAIERADPTPLWFLTSPPSTASPT